MVILDRMKTVIGGPPRVGRTFAFPPPLPNRPRSASPGRFPDPAVIQPYRNLPKPPVVEAFSFFAP